MANFQLAPKLYIANRKKDLTLLFYALAAGGFQQNAALPAEAVARKAAIEGADLLKILQSGDFPEGDITDFSASRGVPGTKHVLDATFGGAGLVSGAKGWLHVKYTSEDKPSELMTYDARNYSRAESFQIIIPAAATPASVRDLIMSQIDALAYKLRLEKFTAVKKDAATITFTANDPTLTLQVSLQMEGEPGGLTLATATTAAPYTGRGNFHALKTWRIANDTNTRPYAGTGPYDGNSNELPEEDGLYTSLLITKSVKRPDLSGSSMVNDGPITGEFQFHLYVNEALTQEIKDLVAYFEAKAVQKSFYVARTSAAATAKETPEATSVNFLTGL